MKNKPILLPLTAAPLTKENQNAQKELGIPGRTDRRWIRITVESPAHPKAEDKAREEREERESKEIDEPEEPDKSRLPGSLRLFL